MLKIIYYDRDPFLCYNGMRFCKQNKYPNFVHNFQSSIFGMTLTVYILKALSASCLLKVTLSILGNSSELNIFMLAHNLSRNYTFLHVCMSARKTRYAESVNYKKVAVKIKWKWNCWKLICISCNYTLAVPLAAERDTRREWKIASILNRFLSGAGNQVQVELLYFCWSALAGKAQWHAHIAFNWALRPAFWH